MKAKTALANRIVRLETAVAELVAAYEQDKDDEAGYRTDEVEARRFLTEGNLLKSCNRLIMPAIYHWHHAVQDVLSGMAETGTQEMVSYLWVKYLDGVCRHNGFHAGTVHSNGDELGIGGFLAAYLLGQEVILSGAATMYLACEHDDNLENFLGWGLSLEAAGSQWDLLYFLRAFGHDISHLVRDENYIEEGIGDFAELLQSNPDRIREVLYELCEAHVYACSKKNEEETQWGLFPVKLLAYMKLAGLAPADYADLHPLLALPTCQLDFTRQYELTDPLILDLRSLAEKLLLNGLFPVEVPRT